MTTTNSGAARTRPTVVQIIENDSVLINGPGENHVHVCPDGDLLEIGAIGDHHVAALDTKAITALRDRLTRWLETKSLHERGSK